MNERLTELYRSCRPKEALASQDEFKSANALLGSEVEKFAELLVLECISALDKDDGATHHSELLLEHFGVEE
jgi:hypothetical protein